MLSPLKVLAVKSGATLGAELPPLELVEAVEPPQPPTNIAGQRQK